MSSEEQDVTQWKAATEEAEGDALREELEATRLELEQARLSEYGARRDLAKAREEIELLQREREFEARGKATFRGADAAVDPLPGKVEEQHRALARGAVEHVARATAPDAAATDLLLADVAQEAGLAWLKTGLLPSSLSERDQAEICRAIAGRVAAVLVLVGWEPPERLLFSPQCSAHPATPPFRHANGQGCYGCQICFADVLDDDRDVPGVVGGDTP